MITIIVYLYLDSTLTIDSLHEKKGKKKGGGAGRKDIINEKKENQAKSQYALHETIYITRQWEAIF